MYSNEYVLKLADSKIKNEHNTTTQINDTTDVVIMSDYHKHRRTCMLSKLTKRGQEQPATQITVNLDTMQRPFLGTRRARGQRTILLEITLADILTDIQLQDPALNTTALSTTNPRHRELIIIFANTKQIIQL